MSNAVAEGNEMDSELLTLRLVMHNWLQNWKTSQNPRMEAGSNKPPFIKNLLPFYWLGQVAILAYEEGLRPFECNSCANLKVEVRFRLVNRWLRHIRNLLSSQDEATTLYWDELMLHRLHSWQQEDLKEMRREAC